MILPDDFDEKAEIWVGDSDSESEEEFDDETVYGGAVRRDDKTHGWDASSFPPRHTNHGHGHGHARRRVVVSSGGRGHRREKVILANGLQISLGPKREEMFVIRDKMMNLAHAAPTVPYRDDMLAPPLSNRRGGSEKGRSPRRHPTILRSKSFERGNSPTQPQPNNNSRSWLALASPSMTGLRLTLRSNPISSILSSAGERIQKSTTTTSNTPTPVVVPHHSSSPPPYHATLHTKEISTASTASSLQDDAATGRRAASGYTATTASEEEEVETEREGSVDEEPPRYRESAEMISKKGLVDTIWKWAWHWR